MLIDFHTHCFPEAVAKKAIPHLETICNTKALTDGTYEDTEKKLKSQGVSKFVVLNIATSAKQQTNVNNFAISINNENSCSLGSIHSDSPNALEELERLKNAGISGVKIHPDYQNVEMDNDSLKEVYSLLSEWGMLCVFHAGFDPVSPDITRVTPQKALKIYKLFPKLKMVLAHMGGYRMQKEVQELLLDTDIYFDTSLAPHFLTSDEAYNIIKNHGADKMLFGSDCPWASSEENFNFIDSLSLTDSEKELIFYKNAELLINKKC